MTEANHETNAADRTTDRVRVLACTRVKGARGNKTIYETLHLSQTVATGALFSRTVLGYAEVPKWTKLGHFDDPEAFRARVEDVAEYVHWKDDESGDVRARLEAAVEYAEDPAMVELLEDSLRLLR